MAEIKHFLRVLNTDLVGAKPIQMALTKIYGIGPSLANAICKTLKINKSTQAGTLSDEDAKKIENLIKSNSLPEWLLNRRKDIETGEDLHWIGSDLKLGLDFGFKRERRNKSYRGSRYAARLPVRGQRTRSNFRNAKGKALGVKRKKR